MNSSGQSELEEVYIRHFADKRESSGSLGSVLKNLRMSVNQSYKQTERFIGKKVVSFLNADL